MKKLFAKIPFAIALSFMLVGCGGTTSVSNVADGSSSSSSSAEGGFSFIHPSTSTTSSSVTPSSSVSKSLDIQVMATINKNVAEADHLLVEAEDCDTSGCTHQAGHDTFYESPDASFPTSGDECLAAISAPSILAFKIDVKGTCDITFSTVCAKYENPWDLDSNVSYYLDENTPFVTGYSEFGHTTENEWYNWKTVTLGTTAAVTAGIHQFNISVKNAFPNTDCFYMTVANYVAA